MTEKAKGNPGADVEKAATDGQPVNEVSKENQALVTESREMCDQLLKKYPKLRALVLIYDWDLPAGASREAPVGVMKTAASQYTTENVSGMMHQIVTFFNFLANTIFRICTSAVEETRQSIESLTKQSKKPEAPQGEQPPAKTTAEDEKSSEPQSSKEG